MPEVVSGLEHLELEHLEGSHLKELCLYHVYCSYALLL